jgi:hypothetical protein
MARRAGGIGGHGRMLMLMMFMECGENLSQKEVRERLNNN